MVTEEKLASWTGPSSSSEQEKQERTERMIREAIDTHEGFEGYRSRFKVYAKGSYANNTNVKYDSDVDIVVECTDVIYWENADPSAPGYSGGESYSGIWTPEHLRKEIGAALRGRFPGSITEGTTAFEVDTSTARVNADVVPSFTFKLYYSSGDFTRGTKVFKKDGSSTENYPNQQLEKGRAKNLRTNYNYKKTVRILKRLENELVGQGLCEPVPSYVLECLIYNCSEDNFSKTSWRTVIQGCLAEIFNHTLKAEPSDNRWLEANGIKFLFHQDQKWTPGEIHRFASAAWDYMELD